MIILPNDVINIILSLTQPNDKIYFSFVSKYFGEYFKNVYIKNKKLSKIPLNCSYDLNLWLQDYGNKRFINFSYTKDVNVLNMITYHALNSGYLYGTHMPYYNIFCDYNHTILKSIIKYTLNIDNLESFNIERNKYKKYVKIEVYQLFNDYCRLDIVNKYFENVVKMLFLYDKYTINKMMDTAYFYKANKVMLYLRGKK